MLSITNGDSPIDLIRQAGVPGEIIAWRDVLHEGPVPAGLSLAELSQHRAEFLADAGRSNFAEVLAQFAARDRRLAESGNEDEVILWFEHDLYDQLQLLQLLDWFAAQPLGPTRLTLICGAEYLGLSEPQRLATRFAARAAVTHAQLELARQGWAAFRDPDPTAIARLLQQDCSPLPFLRASLIRHLQQFPSIRNGLSRSEAQALDSMAAGVRRLGKIYLASHHELEDPIFLGDSTFAWYLARLSQAPSPLLLQVNGSPLTVPANDATSNGFWDIELELTPAGDSVRMGREDQVRLNGIDRWLGGVHLTAERCWRWDEDAEEVRSAL